MNAPLRLALAGAALFFAAGCSHLDLATEGNTDRVLTGTVDFAHSSDLPDSAQLPVGAVLTVRVIDNNPSQVAAPLLTSAQKTQPNAQPSAEVLGEQTVKDPGDPPFRYRVEYRADDDQLRRGLTLEARIEIGGHLRYANTTSYSVQLSDAAEQHPIIVNPVSAP